MSSGETVSVRVGWIDGGTGACWHRKPPSKLVADKTRKAGVMLSLHARAAPKQAGTREVGAEGPSRSSAAANATLAPNGIQPDRGSHLF